MQCSGKKHSPLLFFPYSQALCLSLAMQTGAQVIFAILVVLSIAPLGFSYHNVFNVVNFGAVGDAKRDDTEAFKKAWSATCSVGRYATLLIPRGKTFLVNSYTFTGKCKASRIFVMLEGNLVAPPRGLISNVKSWITFYSIDSLTITGSRHLDGRGYSWWPKECFVKPEGCQSIGYERPTLLSFESCNMLNVNNVRLINSPRNHITVNGCNQVSFSGISISAPEKSPNTDGINIANSNFIKITNLNIASGDDCISFLPGTSNVNVSHITCNPGHGISIGSIYIGKVQKVFVEHCIFSNTQNGVRIKTKQGGSGYVRDIHFNDIQMYSVSNPIIIDQYYFSPRNLTSAVAISNVEFNGIRGTTKGDLAIKLACSQTVPCKDIRLNDVKLKSVDPHKSVYSYCLSIHGPRCPNCSPQVPCLG